MAAPAEPAASEFQASLAADVRFIQGLSDRRLDPLVDAYCRQRWTDPDLTDRQRVELTVAWIRAITGRALASPPGKRETHWKHAAELATVFQQRASAAPRGLLVPLQLALARVAQGEMALQSTEPASQPEPASSALLEARKALRAALAQFEQIDSQIDGRLPRAYQSGPDTADDWSAAELESLRRNVSLQIARALRLQALGYPADSPDRVNSLDRALERLGDLTAMQGAGPVLWQARFETLFCLRLLGRLDQADRLLAAWETGSPPAERPLLAAERLTLLLARQQPEQALASARELLKQAADTRSAETDFAILEVLLAARDKLPLDGTSNQATASALTEQATELAKQLGARHGPLWRQRALVRLGQALATGVEDSTVLGHAAATFTTAGNLDAALATYDRAANLARKSGKRTEAFDLSLAAAAIINRTQGPQAALPRYRQLILRQPLHPRAASAHLTAVGLAAALARQSAPGSPRQQALQAYEGLLQEHLQSWPQAPSAETARWWLARLRIQQQRWLEAADLLGHILHDNDHYEQAVRASLDCYPRGLEQLAAASGPDSTGQAASSGQIGVSASSTRRQVLATATSQWQTVITGTGNRWPAAWTPLQQTVAVALARLQLVESPEGHRYAEKLLTAALTQNDQAPEKERASATWKSQATALLATARARAGNLDDAEGLLQALQGLDGETALTITRALGIRQEPDRKRRQALAQFVLKVLALVATSEIGALDPEQLAELARARGGAHELLDQHSDALAAYRQWMRYRPEDGDAQEACAVLLGKGLGRTPTRKSDSQTDHHDLSQPEASGQQALRLWQQIERRSKPGGPRWRRARQARIALLEQLGRHQQAQKLEQLTRILYP
jgi:hypothetical protein